MSGQFTREQAIAFHDNKAYEPLSFRDRAALQMAQDLLCMPFGVFHEAVEKALGRPVFTHEFAFGGRDRLMKELMGEKPAPTFTEIMELIPAEKRLLIIKAEVAGNQADNRTADDAGQEVRENAVKDPLFSKDPTNIQY
jgi:hypothetical protein